MQERDLVPDGGLSVFDLSLPKLLILAVIALIIFGPKELPKIASQAGRALRDLRRIAEGAKNDLREGLGPEFADFEIEDLNPKRFVQKHLFDDVNGDSDSKAAAPAPGPRQAGANGTLLAPGERPPYDPDAT
jgi:sec-independent protein translocase protein TatB